MKFSTFVTLLRNMLYPIVVIVRHKKTAYGSRLELLLFAFRVIKPSKSQEMALRARGSGNWNSIFIYGFRPDSVHRCSWVRGWENFSEINWIGYMSEYKCFDSCIVFIFSQVNSPTSHEHLWTLEYLSGRNLKLKRYWRLSSSLQLKWDNFEERQFCQKSYVIF